MRIRFFWVIFLSIHKISMQKYWFGVIFPFFHIFSHLLSHIRFKGIFIFFLWSEPVNPPQFGQKNSENKNKNKNNAGRLDWMRVAFLGLLKSVFIWFLKGTMDLEKPVWWLFRFNIGLFIFSFVTFFIPIISMIFEWSKW